MSHNISIRRGIGAALVAASLLVALPGAAGAATPREGYCAGTTAQQGGAVDFKVFKYGSFDGPVRKILKVGATTQPTCASGEVKEDRYLGYIIVGGKIDSLRQVQVLLQGLHDQGPLHQQDEREGHAQPDGRRLQGREHQLDGQAQHRRHPDSLEPAAGEGRRAMRRP